MVKWSLIADLLTLLCINTLLLFTLTAGNFISKKISAFLIIPVFILFNSFAIILNCIDIFYFPFHFQRANADLLYVIDHSFDRLMQQSFWLILAFSVIILLIIGLVYLLHKKLYHASLKGDNCRLFTIILFAGLCLLIIFKKSFTKFLVPTYPMVELNSRQLPVVQNSFHTFVFSVFRGGTGFRMKKYMTDAACDSIFPIRKKLNINNADTSKKNIVLFIMESVPYDFFDSAGMYKVKMPFFDSILQKSTFFNNAFGYSHESNKGITAILTGIPTLTDVPLYHSPYINMPFTHVGTALKKQGYQSIFCIGDEYDNFGFAKCMKWIGIDKYYCKEDISGYKSLPAHTMGLQDEYVLDFFRQKISEQQMPFFAIQYNISTHYPYNIPESFSKNCPADYTAPMKAMLYYDHSLQQFFKAAKKEPWFANTKFIFCSDHWLFPQGKLGPYTAVSANHIPIIIFDPSDNKQKINNRLASQFDLHATILAAAGYRDSIVSYGSNLLDTGATYNFVFSKSGNSIYQVMNNEYILGFNAISNKAEYLNDYKKDKLLKTDLSADKNHQQVLNSLLKNVQAFIQKTNAHYNGASGK